MEPETVSLQRDDIETFLDATKLFVARVSSLQSELLNRKPVEAEAIAALQKHVKEIAVAVGNFRVCLWLAVVGKGI
jgi:hypothetical protein